MQTADIPLIRNALLSCELTRRLPDELMEIMLTQGLTVKDCPAGSLLFREGDRPDAWYIVLEGQLAVLKQDPKTQEFMPIAALGPGQTVGEMSLVDQAARSASIQASVPTRLLAFDLKASSVAPDQRHALILEWQAGLGRVLSQRLRQTNDTTAQALGEQLLATQQQLEMSKFIFRLVVGLCIYMFALGLTTALSKVVSTTSVISIPILIVFAVGVVRTIQTSPWPPRVYGFTLAHWQRHAMEAVLWSLPVLGLIVLIKWLALRYVPGLENQPLFDLGLSTGLTGWQLALAALAYCLFTPVQETIARCAIQTSLQILLTHKHRIRDAIFLSNLTFSVTHIHISLTLALAVFPLGLFWGWMFARQGSMVGSSVSHALIGTFALSILGVPVL